MDHRANLICRERLRRNWSQSGLCRGICAVSYLSKIETGKAEPSEEILRLLLERLGLAVDETLEAEAKRLADEGYELLFSGEAEALRALFASFEPERYRGASAGLDLLLLAAAPDRRPLEEVPERCMDARQLALQRLAQGRGAEAIALMPNGYLHQAVGSMEYEAGRYAAAAEYLQRGYELAAGEGAPKLMLLCRTLIGNICCNRQDIVNMEKHYAVARRLATALGDAKMLRIINYNTASAQIEVGEYEAAYVFFSALEDPDLMSLHKLAICCEKTGRRAQALSALDRADAADCDWPPRALAGEMCALVRYRLEHPDYLRREEYGALLMNCFEACRQTLPAGYAAFHLPWTLEWLTAARQYKLAYELMRDFPDYRGLE